MDNAATPKLYLHQVYNGCYWENMYVQQYVILVTPHNVHISALIYVKMKDTIHIHATLLVQIDDMWQWIRQPKFVYVAAMIRS